MAGNRKKGKAEKIILIGLLTVIICIAAVILLPKNRSFNNVYELYNIPEWLYISGEDYNRDDHGYHYLATNSLYKVYVDSHVDLSQELRDNDSDESDNLGAQKLHLKLTGIRMISEDMMGVTVKYPLLVYEYVE